MDGRIRCRVVRGITLALCLPLIASSSWAAGLYLYELGTPDLGTAQAGQAALPQAASLVVRTPAGMTRLEGSQLTGSLYTILPSMQFERGPGTTLSGGNGFNAGVAIPSSSSASVPLPAGGV